MTLLVEPREAPPERAAERLHEALQAFQAQTEKLRREYERLRRDFDRVSRELEKRNRDLAESLGELERSRTLAALGELAAQVAHEVRNPLGGIEGFASLLWRSLPPEDSRRSLAQKILDGVRSLDGLVEDLLERARPAACRLRPVALAPVMQRSAELALSRAAAGGMVEVEVRPGPPGLEVLADPGPLQQALVNLLRNAAEAMPRGGRITLEAAEEGEGEARVTVSDTGIGMTREVRERVSTPFFTTKEGGTGLGLAIVRGILHAHGGAVEVASAPGEGTRVALRLPRASAAAVGV